MRKKVPGKALAALIGGVWILTGCKPPASDSDSQQSSAPAHAPVALPAPSRPSTPIATVTLPDFASLVERNGPAVVNITVTATTRSAGEGFPGLDPQDPFSQFFRRFMPQQRPQIVRGAGSGFIVRKDGVILTNSHVVNGAKEVNVKLTDRREFAAKVLGQDPRTDVAVLKIDAKDLPVVTTGNPENVRVGEWVVAIGSPFNFENSVTAGIVSAKARSLPDDSAVPFIQTDVAVNPGNSGGPLFNLNGEVIGINSQIYSRSGGYQGISFAIPIDVALKVEEQILKTGKVQHARLGVRIQPLTQDLAKAFGLGAAGGALVGKVEPGSAAERGGIKQGDIILSVDGRPIIDAGQLAAVIAGGTPGTQVELEIWRDRRKQTLKLRLGKDEDNSREEAGQQGPGQDGDLDRLGLLVRPLTPQEREASGLKQGLIVEEASDAAAQAGIEPGDVILAVNGKPIASTQALRDAVRASRGPIALLVQRGDAQLYIPVNPG